LSWQLNDTLSVRVLVNPKTNASRLTATVTCGEAQVTANASVSSDVDLQFSWTTSPSPADKGKELNANVILTNHGGHPAVGVQCTATPGELTCVDGEPDSKPCQVAYLQPSASTILSLNFPPITEDTDVTITCTAHNLPAPLTSTYTILLKNDAQLEITSELTPEAKVAAGSNFTMTTKIQNNGRAQADALVCDLSIEKPDKTIFLGVSDPGSNCTAVLTANVTTGAHCKIGDFKPSGNLDVSLQFHVDAAVTKDNEFKFTWNCTAAGLEDKVVEQKVTTKVESSLAIILPANSSIAAGNDALLFHMQNPGPSYVRDGTCTFILPKGVETTVWSSSPYFHCDKLTDAKKIGDGAGITCNITEIPPGYVDFNPSLSLTDSTIKQFDINASCETKDPVSNFSGTFNINVGVAPSPSPTPGPPVNPPDNTMMVVVTVIVAIGLLIVIAIWWRRKQDRSGWDAAGPSSRSPSLNRFSDVELSLRSDD
jgi:hypothetical protein